MIARRAHVRFKNQTAGLLEETPRGGTTFTYLETWSEPIACALPIEVRRTEWPQGLHPVFQNLGPEGWLRQQQARAGRVQQEDDFGLLLRYGADCIGAISVHPIDEQEAGAEAQFGDETARAATGSQRTVSGVQRKLLAWHDGKHFHPATNDSPAGYIAKFAPEAEPGLLRNEAHSLKLAQEFLGKNEVTLFELANIKGIAEHALLVSRFDRTQEGEKLRLEDFAQILSRPHGADFKGKYEGSYEEIAEAIKSYSSRSEIDIARFFSALVFTVLIGNADAHLKNWSLLEKKGGLRLSPQYDLLNILIYDGKYDTRIALDICDQRPQLDQIDRDLMFNFANNIGLPERVAQLRLDNLHTKAARSKLLKPIPAEDPDGFRSRYTEVVRNACQRILKS